MTGMRERRTQVPEGEFYKMTTLWLHQRHGFKSVQEVLKVKEEKYETGYCHTCAGVETVLEITYRDKNGKESTTEIKYSFTGLIKELEELAWHEERRRPRMLMFASLQRILKAANGDPNMMFRVLTEYIRYTNKDGERVRVHKGQVVDYLPPNAIVSLVKDGSVQPLCTTSEPGDTCPCEWHRLAALTSEDRDWLGLYGWKNPFTNEVP